MLSALHLTVLPFCRRTQGWPFVGVMVAWIIALVVIVGGILVVFAFGISFGNDVVHQWVTSIIVSLFVNLTITQSMPVLILNFER